MSTDRPGWTHVRVREETREMLTAWCRRTLADVQARNRTDVPYSPENGVSVDVAIRVLLARDQKHRERSNRPRRKKHYEG